MYLILLASCKNFLLKKKKKKGGLGHEKRKTTYLRRWHVTNFMKRMLLDLPLTRNFLLKPEKWKTTYQCISAFGPVRLWRDKLHEEDVAWLTLMEDVSLLLFLSSENVVCNYLELYFIITYLDSTSASLVFHNYLPWLSHRHPGV